MDVLLKTGAQILFGLATLFFVIYSIVAIYSLTTFGRNKGLTTAIAFVYSVIVIGLVGWGLVVLTQVK